MSAPLTSVVGIMSPGTWALGYGLSISRAAPIAPCEGVSAVPATDTSFELQRMTATMEPAVHLPVRGSST